MLQRIDFKKVLLNWHLFVQEINAQQPKVTRTRKVKGEEKLFTTQRKLITGNVEATGTRLITDYIKSYEKARTITGLEGLPSLAANCPNLGRRRTVSERTIRNHLAILRNPAVGLISGYKFHGTSSDFELWISPKFLWENIEKPAFEAPIAQSEKTHISALLPPQSKNFPLIKSLETPETKEKEISNVNKGVAEPQHVLAKAEDTGPTTGDTFTGHTGPQRQAKRAKGRAPRPVASIPETSAPGGAAAAAKPPQNEAFKEFVISFWLYAWKLIYPGWAFTEEEQRKAKNAIWSSIYGGFRADWSLEDWQSYQDSLLKRVDLAATYFHNNPEKYPPKPYAEWIAGTGYFDNENDRGFKKTHAWLLKKLAWQEQNRVEDALRRAKKELRAHPLGKAPKHQQEKSLLQLFRYHEARIKHFGDEGALKRFYAQTTDFKPSYPTLNL